MEERWENETTEGQQYAINKKKKKAVTRRNTVREKQKSKEKQHKKERVKKRVKGRITVKVI